MNFVKDRVKVKFILIGEAVKNFVICKLNPSNGYNYYRGEIIHFSHLRKSTNPETTVYVSEMTIASSAS